MAVAQDEPAAHVLIFTETTQFRHGDAITQGTPRIRAALEAAGITSEHTEDSSVFNDEDLARFDALVMFQTSGDPWTAAEKAAMERYQQAGGGIVGIHNATDMRGDYPWWDNLVGALMPGHAATDGPGPEAGLPAEVVVEDQVHPSTDHLEDTRWARADEWYNFNRNVRGDAHVLLTVDETTYDAGGNRMGSDHPISWCKPYDGGRAWITAMGHFGAHYSEPQFMEHIVGGVQYAAGLEPGDCGGTRWESYEKVTLDDNTSAPFELEVAPDGRVFYTELALGQLRVWNPETSRTTVALDIDVYTGGEDGMLGIALDPDFADNGYVYIYYSPASEDDEDPANWINRLSRFTVENNAIDPGTEQVVIEVPAHRDPASEPGHTGGAVEFGPDGNLYLSVGDDTRPFESDGRTPIDERPGRELWDAQRSSGNTNDLRGKILRITPDYDADGGYTIPAGNLFAPGTMGTRPEIFVMGFRNPFRFKIDPETGWLGVADYGPDTGVDDPNRGPRGYVEWNLVKQAGNYGWPYCHGPNLPYRDYNFATGVSGPAFNCAAPINESPNNTGLRELPPVIGPEAWYSYGPSPEFPEFGQGGAAPMGGPFYRYDAELESDTKFPEYFDGKAFFMEWARNYVKYFVLSDDGELEKINPFLPNQQFLSPMDMVFGPEGAMYMLDWGGGYGRDNPASSLYRIDYTQGDRSPVARAEGTPDSGSAPLEVQFSSEGSEDPEGGEVTYAWDFGDGATSTEPNPTHTYTANGEYTAQLTVTDAGGKTGTTNVDIVVGNSRPELTVETPPNGGFFEFGDTLSWNISVTDAEDGSTPDGIDCDEIVVQPSLGHDAHAHYESQVRGCTGSTETGFGGHEAEANLAYVINAQYTDEGAEGVRQLTDREIVLLHPKRVQAEHFTSMSGVDRAASEDVEGGGAALVGLGEGDWLAFDPVNFTGIDSIDLRVAASRAGGAIELRAGAPDGELLATAQVPDTGGVGQWADVTVDAPATTETMALYLVFRGDAGFRLNFFEANGKGVSPIARPDVTLTSPMEDEAFDPGVNTLTADVTDAENEITEVEFFVNGESVGTDTSAPYSVEWNETTEDYYTAYAVARNAEGLEGRSRTRSFTVGQIGVRPPWQTFASTEAEFSQLGSTFTISAAGADVWQGTNEYGAIYLPGDGGENFTATVRVASFDGTHGASKAGIIVRNDVTQASASPGYLVLGEKGNGEAEFLHDAAGNGQLNNAGEPVATACPGDQPTWLRVTKVGTSFSAYCSKDGTTWTQVGVTTQIPSATTAQDVGLFVVSHITGTLATAQFTDWSLETDTEGPEEPEEPSEPTPSCAGNYSDEFDGPLSESRWTTVRGMNSNAGGALVLPVTQGDINEATAGPISFVGQPVPNGDWVVETKVDIDHDNEWQHAALAQLVDDNNYIKLAYTQNQAGSRFLEYQTETNGARTWHANNVTIPATAGNTMYLRLSRTGNALTGSYSLDGQAWTTLPGTATLKPGGSLGVFAAGDTDAQNVNAAFDYLRVTPDVTPEDPGVDDEFDGDALDGCRWNRIVGYNSNRLSVAGGRLSIDTFDADINGAQNGDIENLILQDAPEGDWTVETKMTAPLAEQYQLAGLMAYVDDDHYVKYNVVADNLPGGASDLRVELRYENGGGLTGPTGASDIDPPASANDTWWLRLTKTGNTYTGSISTDGETWVQSPGSVTVELDDPAVGVFAIGPQQDEGPVTVDFDYFRVVDDEPEPDNTAPELGDVTATPASGAAPLQVRFAAPVTDAEDDELTYSWDFDGDGEEDSTQASPTHTYTEAGEYQATVTVSDGEFEDTATVTVTVEEDTEEPGEGAPTVQGFADPASGPAPLRVRFSATGLDPEGGKLRYRWEFGDEGAALTPMAVRTYTQPGTYTATVTVTDEDGNTASDEVEIVVGGSANGAPEVEATADMLSGPAAPMRVRLSAEASDDGPMGRLTYAWNFGDGGTAFGRNAVHQYMTPGTYTATVTVTDAGGAEGSDSVQITVQAPPANVAPTVVAAADAMSGVAPMRVRLTSQGADSDGDRMTYSWDFGDGSPAAAVRNGVHVYTQPGTYTAKVTVTDEDGATGSAEVRIVVSGRGNTAPTVQAAADPAGGAAPMRVRFTSAARDADGDMVATVWDFGDGAKAGGPTAIHTYTTAGVYNATVTVMDPSGATSTATVRVTVAAPTSANRNRAGHVPGRFVSQVKLAKRAQAREVVRRGLRYRVTCAAACGIRSELRVDRRTARKLGLSGTRKGARLGRASARTTAAGKTRTVVVKVKRSLRRQLLASMKRNGVKSVEAIVLTRVRGADGASTVHRKLTLRR